MEEKCLLLVFEWKNLETSFLVINNCQIEAIFVQNHSRSISKTFECKAFLEQYLVYEASRSWNNYNNTAIQVQDYAVKYNTEFLVQFSLGQQCLKLIVVHESKTRGVDKMSQGQDPQLHAVEL